MSGAEKYLHIPVVQADVREVLSAVQGGREADVDATRLEDIDTYLETVGAAVEEVRRRRDNADDIAAHVVLPETVELSIEIGNGESVYEDPETVFIIEALKLSGGEFITREDINKYGYNLLKDRSVQASNQAFRIRIRRLVEAGIVERDGNRYKLIGDPHELARFEDEEKFIKRAKDLYESDRDIGEFHEKGACADLDSDFFFTKKGEDTEPQKAVCKRCPVRAECLVQSLRNGDRHGVFGGKSNNQRVQLGRLWRQDLD